MKLTIEHFAQIEHAELNFGEPGDLTVLVGPQATGKSLALQWLKLLQDPQTVKQDFEKFNFDWDHFPAFADLYFGEGMSNGLSNQTTLKIDDTTVDLNKLFYKKKRPVDAPAILEKVFYIPAHRGLLLAEGWPKLFQQHQLDTPYVARKASELLNATLLFSRKNNSKVVFPKPSKLQDSLRSNIDRAVFHGATLEQDSEQSKRRLVLKVNDQTNIPFMAWTAGQREFVPMMLALYDLMPAGGQSKMAGIETVILEEPELGLHPQALMSVGLAILHLLSRKYRVIVSTHSALMLEFTWMLSRLSRNKVNGVKEVKKLFSTTEKIAAAAMSAKVNVHYLDYNKFINNKVTSRDISSLDLFGDDPDVAGWGGLSSYSVQFSNIVARS
jgi:AAA domain, putative AbiEii toxin, Type IV TA system